MSVYLSSVDFRVIGLIISAVVFFASAGFKLIRIRRTASGRYKRTEGRVSHVYSAFSSSNILSSKGRSFEIGYIVDGKSYTVTNPGDIISIGSFSIYSRRSRTAMQVGEKVDLMYDSHNPQIVWLPDTRSSAPVIVISAVLMIGFSLSLIFDF